MAQDATTRTRRQTNGRQPARARDPVCGMELDPAKAAATYDHRGKTYYFDSVECAMKFGNSPDAFIDPPEVR